MDEYTDRMSRNVQPSIAFVNLFDTGVQNCFLTIMNSIYLIVTIVIFIKMKKRQKGFNLRWILVAYDASNVIIALWIAVSILLFKLEDGFNLVCNNVANNRDGHHIAKVFLIFYLQKYYEFLDTWFFLLRKSSRQVTFLHLFHHSSITVVVGSILPFDYNGDMFLPIILNSTNHALVYLHYLLATLGIQSCWAPYITYLQLMQFCLIFIQSSVAYYMGPNCGSPDFAKVLMLVYMGSMIALFSNYFLKKYILQQPTTNLDMCGVIKRPLTDSITRRRHPLVFSGTAQLDQHGTRSIFISGADNIAAHQLLQSFDSGNYSCQSSCSGKAFELLSIAYTLTALGKPMPNLHVSKELGFNPPLPTIQEDFTDAAVSSDSITELSNGNLHSNNTTGVRHRKRNYRDRKRRSNSTLQELNGLIELEKIANSGGFDQNKFTNSQNDAGIFKSASYSEFQSIKKSSEQDEKCSWSLEDRIIDGRLLPILGTLGNSASSAIGCCGEAISGGINTSFRSLRRTLSHNVLSTLAIDTEILSNQPEVSSVAGCTTTSKTTELSNCNDSIDSSISNSQTSSICSTTGEDKRINSQKSEYHQQYQTNKTSDTLPIPIDSFMQQLVPLYFNVSGGNEYGRISWVLYISLPEKTQPTPFRDAGKLRDSSDSCEMKHTQGLSALTESELSRNNMHEMDTKDWRALSLPT